MQLSIGIAKDKEIYFAREREQEIQREKDEENKLLNEQIYGYLNGVHNFVKMKKLRLNLEKVRLICSQLLRREKMKMKLVYLDHSLYQKKEDFFLENIPKRKPIPIINIDDDDDDDLFLRKQEKKFKSNQAMIDEIFETNGNGDLEKNYTNIESKDNEEVEIDLGLANDDKDFEDSDDLMNSKNKTIEGKKKNRRSFIKNKK